MRYVALGGNQGPVLDTFRWALTQLQAAGVRPVAVSRAYRTEALPWPHGHRDATPLAPYWNAVCQVDTTHGCDAVLQLGQQLENRVGRQRGVRWGPRPLDIDLLLWGPEVICSAVLTVPHPRLHERLFVLRPLAELAPDLVVPTLGRSVRSLLLDFDDAWDGILMRRGFWNDLEPQKIVAPTRVISRAQVIAAQGN